MLQNLELYMLIQCNLNKYYILLEDIDKKNKDKENKDKENKDKDKDKDKDKENCFLINQNDKLFWAFYIFLHGYENYHLITNFFITEKNYKINCITTIRKNKDKLKLHKISKNSVENDLVNEININLNSLNCLALLYNLNIIYIKKKLIYIMNYSSEKIINCKNIIQENNKKIYIINLSEELIKELIETYYIIENINKPLNAISYYKLNDLINIAKKLNLEILHKQKKDIYTEISNYIKN
jgi:hypothetical protein